MNHEGLAAGFIITLIFCGLSGTIFWLLLQWTHKIMIVLITMLTALAGGLVAAQLEDWTDAGLPMLLIGIAGGLSTLFFRTYSTIHTLQKQAERTEKRLALLDK